MKNKKDKSIIKTISLNMVFIIILVGIVTGIFISMKEVTNYREKIDTFRKYVINEKKELIKTEIRDVINFIDIKKEKRVGSIKKNVKDRVYEAHAIATHLYTIYHGTKSDDEIKSLIVETLRPIRFFEGRGYYFIDDLNGVTHLFPGYAELEEKSTLFIKDPETGKSIIGAFIKIAKEKGEGYSEYLWYSLKDKTKRYKKIAYVKLFEPYNWIIGTGEYYMGNEEDLKKEILSYIEKRRYTKNGYFFVLNKDGVMLSHPFRPQDVGKDVRDVKDKTGKYVTKELLKVAEKSEGGFVEYIWKNPATGRYAKKITYAKLYPDWGWIIGTGIYLDDIDAYIKKEGVILKKNLKKELTYTGIAIILFIIIVFGITSLISKRIKENINNMVSFFKAASTLHKRIDEDKIYFREAKIVAHSANRLIEDIEKNEKKASTILSIIPDLMFILDKEGHFVEYKAEEDNLYKSPRKFLGKKISEVFPEKLSKQFEDAIEKTFKTGDLVIVNYTLPYEDKYGFFEARLIKISDRYVLALIRDITGERELQRRLDITLRSIGDAVISTDKGGKVEFLNPVAEKLTGWSEEEARGKRLKEVFNIVSEVTEEKIENPVEKVIKTGKIMGLGNHTVLISKEGTRRVIEDSASPIMTKEGSILGVVLVFRDVTEKRKMEQEIARTEKLKSIGILASGIAHDFNNLLTGMLGYIEILRLGINDEKLIEKIEKLQNITLKAKNLAYRLLTFARAKVSKKEVIDITKLVRDTVSLALSGSSVKVDYVIDSNIWPVEVDRTEMEQVIQNIVLNAKEATDGRGKIEIRIKNETIKEEKLPVEPGEYVRIDIKDNGPGIPKDILGNIFDPFFTTKEFGSGLGLAISYSIVEQLRGYIEVKSREGKGTLFSIYIPKSKKGDGFTEKSNKENDTINGRGKRVLIMDDQKDIREILTEELKILGFEVYATENGEEAVDAYRKAAKEGRPFDIVILDLTVVGGMGGKEAAKRIKEMDKEAVIIVSSGYSEGDTILHYKDYGFSEVLKKPYTLEELKRVMKKIVKKGGE